jgi:hypothetical protein
LRFAVRAGFSGIGARCRWNQSAACWYRVSSRQWCKRLTRLTYAFSKKWGNLKAALALHFAYYNFCRIHGSLRITPAMAAGIADHVWDLAELLR